MARMTTDQIKAMNKKRYGKLGRKPTAKELEASYKRQSPSTNVESRDTNYPEKGSADE